MSLFHFNIEYVIGGLDYTDHSGKRHLLVDQQSAAGWDNDRVEDWIVTESFHPILAMCDKHPDWGVDIELQAYMVEVLAARHPQTLALLRKLAVRGQVELVSFHNAAQLFLAFPYEDHARSISATKAVFDAHCLPRSGVVFNQERQSGEGRQRALVAPVTTSGSTPATRGTTCAAVRRGGPGMTAKEASSLSVRAAWTLTAAWRWHGISSTTAN